MTEPQPEYLEIAVHNVKPSAWNSRVERDEDKAKLKALAESIKAEGQLSPVQVCANAEGGYDLIFGNRRLAACKLAGLTTIKAQVVSGVDGLKMKVRNATENAVRQDLSTYEMARLCSELRAEKLKLGEVASILGISQQMVSNYCVTYDGLHPDILEDWKNEEPGTSINALRVVVQEADQEAQLRKYDEMQAQRAKLEADPDKPKSGKAAKGEGGGVPIKAIPARLKEAVYLAKSKKTPPMLKNNDGSDGYAQTLWLKNFIDWLVATTDKRPPGFPELEDVGSKTPAEADKHANAAKPAKTAKKGK